MTKFSDRVRNSEALSNLREADELLKELADRDWQHQTTIDLISRLITVTKHILARMTIADRFLVPESSLNNLQSPSNSFLEFVNQLFDCQEDEEPDIEHGSLLADEVLLAGYALPVLPIRTTPEVLQKATEQFDTEVRSKSRLLVERLEDTHTRVATIRDEANLLAAKNEQLEEQFENQLIDQLSQARSEVGESLERTREATEQLERDVTSIQEVFRESQRQREVSFTESQNRQSVEFSENLDPIVSEIEDFRDQAKSMLEEVAGASSAEHYAKLRDKQDAAANVWRKIGVVALVCWVIASGWIFYDSRIGANNVDIASIISRSSFAFPLVVLATYALRQSGHHRQREEDISE